jgi:hypothetical protein
MSLSKILPVNENSGFFATIYTNSAVSHAGFGVEMWLLQHNAGRAALVAAAGGRHDILNMCMTSSNAGHAVKYNNTVI